MCSSKFRRVRKVRLRLKPAPTMQARPLARRLFSAVPRLPERTVAALERHCKVSRNRSVLLAHGKDESHHEAVPPEAVCFAESTDEVVAVVRLCAEARCPIIPYGAGTSLEGHLQALHGGVSLDLSAMDEARVARGRAARARAGDEH